MSRLDELIGELCPDGVTFQPLGNVCEIRSGWGFPNAEQGKKEGEFPFFKVGDMNNDGNEMFMYTANNYIDAEVVKKLKCKPAPEGTIIFPKIGAAIGTNKKRILVKESCYDNNVMGLIASQELNPRFLFYIMHSVDLMSFTDSAGAVPSIRKSAVEKYNIPVPPLEVQSEIVRILDNFTELTAELAAELTARKQQYEYYKELVFEKYITEETVFGSLNNITDVRDGTHDSPKPSNVGKYLITSKNVKNGTINFDGSYLISEEDFISINARSKVDKWDLLFTMIGTVGEVGLVTDEPDYAIKNVGLIKTNSEILARFLYFFLTTKRVKKYIEDNRSKGSQVFLALGKLRNLPVPKLSEEEMKQIIAIISRFDKLCFDISEGLPAEIEARQKQYEYYRDKLLTFKQLA